MQIGSKAEVAPKVEIASPPRVEVSRPQVSLPQLQTGFEAARSHPVNLTGTGTIAAYQQTGGTGATNPAGNVPQAWGNTCGPNTIMAMEAAVDEGRADFFAGLTGDERAAYEAAIMNSNPAAGNAGFIPGPNVDGGWGYTQMSRQVRDRFGGLDEALTGNNYAGNQQGAADAMVTALESGRPVAIGLPDHWMAATEIRGEGDSAEVLIHDSWTGTSAWVPVSEIASGSDWVEEHFPGLPSGSTVEALVVPSTDSLNAGSACRANEAAALEDVEAQQGNWTQRELPEPAQPSAPGGASALPAFTPAFRFGQPIPV